MQTQIIRRSLALGGIALFLATSSFAGEGFGTFKKRMAMLERITPPAVRIEGTRIAVKAKDKAGDKSGLADSLASLLESKILNGDPRLSAAASSPDTLIEVTVVENQGTDKSEIRTEVKMVDDDDDKDAKGNKDAKGHRKYKAAKGPVHYRVVKYHIRIAYKVQDVRSHKNLYADTLSLTLGGDFKDGEGAPELSALKGEGTEKAAHDIAVRLTPSIEQVGVLLPRGSLDDIANFAEAKLWNKYLEALESMPAKAKGEDESYRQYALGLGYEALGYAAEDSETALKYLQQASIHYNSALDANPKEKYFSLPYDRTNFNLPFLTVGEKLMTKQSFAAPPERVRAALVKYQRTKEQQADQPTQMAAKGGKSLPASASQVAALDNAAVIDMARAELSDDVILTAIAGAERTSFDVTPHGLIELSQAKVSKKVIQKIQTIATRQKKP
jgi:hypothetical protein